MSVSVAERERERKHNTHACEYTHSHTHTSLLLWSVCQRELPYTVGGGRWGGARIINADWLIALETDRSCARIVLKQWSVPDWHFPPSLLRFLLPPSLPPPPSLSPHTRPVCETSSAARSHTSRPRLWSSSRASRSTLSPPPQVLWRCGASVSQMNEPELY